jgi:Protein of unknown function (DUF1549)/Protein of unknown function (DUF1553)
MISDEREQSWVRRSGEVILMIALSIAVTGPAAWAATKSKGGGRDAPLALRRPTVPDAAPASGLTNPIDLLLQPYFQANEVAPGEPVPDRVYARRVYLDLVGLLPPTAELEAFIADKSPDKRQRLVQRLLDDKRAYADHWLTFWNDALRNAYRGTGYIDGGRKQITGWLYRALYENKPYDKFVSELLDPPAGSEAEGFIYGIKWRGVVNESQRREMQAAQTLSQVFLGINIKCASCHDSFINNWELTDSYGLASVFADGPLELHRCNKPMAKTVEARFLYPQLGTIDPKATKAVRLEQLAAAMTSPKNGRLARTIVNRLWAVLMGRGLVEPVDDMDMKPWDADVLDWLAADLVDHGYDLKHTMTVIVTSRAYQLPSVGAPDPNLKTFTFRGPLVKRMTGEQFVDALSALTGQWQRVTGAMLRLDGRQQGGQVGEVLEVIKEDAKPPEAPPEAPAEVRADKPAPAPKESVPARAPAQPEFAEWIWSHAEAARTDGGGRIFLRRAFTLDARPASAHAVVTCDNEFVLYVNGKRVAVSDNWGQPVRVDLTAMLVKGANVIAAEAINWPDPETGKGLNVSGGNPAGFALIAQGVGGDGQPAWTIVSDDQWLWRKGLDEYWNEADYEVKGWKHAALIARGGTGPWNMRVSLASGEGGAKPQAATSGGESGGDIDKVRAALADNDPLMQAMGRPNREQVVTRRDSIATTLQALELTNGETLDTMLKRGAGMWLSKSSDSPDALVKSIYETALGRPPTPTELTAARDLVGSPASVDGAADLLWVLVMLPEFQLIY